MKAKLKEMLVAILDHLQKQQLKYVDVTGITNGSGWLLIPNVDAATKEVVSVVSLNTGGYVTLFGRFQNGYVVYLGGNPGPGFSLYPNTGFQIRVWYYDI